MWKVKGEVRYCVCPSLQSCRLDLPWPPPSVLGSGESWGERQGRRERRGERGRQGRRESSEGGERVEGIGERGEEGRGKKERRRRMGGGERERELRTLLHKN